MSEHTPITGELREAVEWEPTFCGPDRAMVPQPEFDRICDAIDAVHAGLERENAELRQRVAKLDESADSMHETDAWKLGYDEGFASADDWLGQHEDAMAEHGWVRLPVDADGAPIHVGDSIEIIGGEDGVAVAIELCEDGGWNVSMRQTGWDTPTLFAAESVRHHHAPTVEDVLREFAQEMNENLGMYSGEAIDADEWRDADAKTIAEYAAKLRLAEGEDA